ncbi:BTB domain-containing protein [Mycena indigotica]|uniref:BTB domain-containing protein n=1 Tax=Mycena indigotica TaxID=2126181 RepID=A0A8H6WDR0_9AGAR|nr:BTB domain-containing protein [Mycena indigotica]KAF7314939.1 BTB domain-containing protein [Mycena indigotica]
MDATISNEYLRTGVAALWLDDGSIVLRAQKTLFKVSRSLLSLRSGFFRDMLASPQTGGDAQVLDGCIMVDLPEKADDVEALLRAVFDSDYFMPPPAKIDLMPLLSILRLARKYDIQYLYKRALSHLDHVMFYVSHSAFLTAPRRDTIMIPPSMVTKHLFVQPLSTLSNSPAALLITLEAINAVQAKWLLPIAHYWLCTMPLKHLLTIPEETLSGTQLRWILQNRKALATKRARILENINQYGWDAECGQAGQCSVARMNVLSHYIRRNADGDDVRMLNGVDFEQRGLCTLCLQSVDKLCTDALEQAWSALPAMFDVSDWGDLTEERSHVLDLLD